MKRKHKVEEKLIHTRRRVIVWVLATIIVFTGMSYAWYVIVFDKDISSEAKDVMAPYYMYLLNKDSTDYLNLTIGNMHPGEVKQEIICVSNKKPSGDETLFDIAKNSTFNYQLELAYTENLPIEYTVFELIELADGETKETIESAGGRTSDVVIDGVSHIMKMLAINTRENVSSILHKEVFKTEELNSLNSTVNVGRYDLFQKDSMANNLSLSANVVGGSTQYENDYYMIEVRWKNGIIFSDYTKETDLVYVIVNALQAKPEEVGE